MSNRGLDQGSDGLTDKELEVLLAAAWRYRDAAVVSGRTRVGAAVLADSKVIYGGCNLQHRYRSQDLHAEVVAIAGALSSGESTIRALAVVCETSDLPPCGACLDWILQIGGDDCIVAWQRERGHHVFKEFAGVLMPYHPSYGPE